MVDKVSPLALKWAPKDQPLSDAYKSVVDGMNEATAARPSEKAIAAYNKAQAYLQDRKEPVHRRNRRRRPERRIRGLPEEPVGADPGLHRIYEPV